MEFADPISASVRYQENNAFVGTDISYVEAHAIDAFVRWFISGNANDPCRCGFDFAHFHTAEDLQVKANIQKKVIQAFWAFNRQRIGIEYLVAGGQGHSKADGSGQLLNRLA